MPSIKMPRPYARIEFTRHASFAVAFQDVSARRECVPVAKATGYVCCAYGALGWRGWTFCTGRECKASVGRALAEPVAPGEQRHCRQSVKSGERDSTATQVAGHQ